MSRWFVLSVALTVLAFASTLGVYYGMFDSLPEQVPTHWNISDEPDQWTPRDKILPMFLLLPGFMVLFTMLTLALPWLSPKPFSVESFRPIYDYVMALVVALMGYIQVAVLYGSFHPEGGMGRVLLSGLFVFFALMGNVLGQVRRNFWMGIRTPWTLASDAVWIQTHRLGAWMFVGAGILGFVGTIAGVPMLWNLGWILIAALGPVIYSLVLYKRMEREGKLEANT